MSSHRAGSNIDSWCTKCKLVLAHTIEAVAEDQVKRVQCNTCGGKHQYKAAAPGVKKSVTKSLKNKMSSAKKFKASDLARLLSNRDVDKAMAYKISQKFSRGNLISHNKFGIGVVVEERDSSKIEVLFESGSKILIHARGC